MIVVTDVGEFDVPYTVAEISFNQFETARGLERDFFQVLDEEEEEEVEKDSLDYMYKIISTYVKGDVSSLPVGKANLTHLINTDYLLSIGEEFDIITLYAHITNLIKNFVPTELPTEFSFEHKGETYFICPNRSERLLTGKSYTLAEVVELKEFNRVTASLVETSGDYDGNLSYNLGLSEMAILARKDEESFPINRREAVNFINERKQIFADLPMDVVLSTRFFFINTLILYVNKLHTPSSSKEKSLY